MNGLQIVPIYEYDKYLQINLFGQTGALNNFDRKRREKSIFYTLGEVHAIFWETLADKISLPVFKSSSYLFTPCCRKIFYTRHLIRP